PVQARLHMAVLRDILLIVISEELVCPAWPKHRQSDQPQHQANEPACAPLSFPLSPSDGERAGVERCPTSWFHKPFILPNPQSRSIQNHVALAARVERGIYSASPLNDGSG